MCTLTLALEPEKGHSEEIKTMMTKYFSKIQDIDSQYVLNQGMANSISRYFKGKLDVFPLFRIKLTIDRNPVRIPWKIGEPRGKDDGEPKYKIVNLSTTEATPAPTLASNDTTTTTTVSTPKTKARRTF